MTSSPGRKLRKKDTQAFFAAIRASDNETVRSYVSMFPELVLSAAPPPPKHEAGESGLAIALWHGNVEAAAHLLECGADVNHRGVSGDDPHWMTVLHRAVWSCVFGLGTDKEPQFRQILQRMLEKGADPNLRDGWGNGPLQRALLDARQRLDRDPGFPDEATSAEPFGGLRWICRTLLEAGADPGLVEGNGQTILERWADEPIMMALLDRAT